MSENDDDDDDDDDDDGSDVLMVQFHFQLMQFHFQLRWIGIPVVIFSVQLKKVFSFVLQSNYQTVPYFMFFSLFACLLFIVSYKNLFEKEM